MQKKSYSINTVKHYYGGMQTSCKFQTHNQAPPPTTPGEGDEWTLEYWCCSHVWPEVFIYLLTYKLSQDHLELFFWSVRGWGGWNNNPPVCHFKGAWWTLLLNNKVRMKGTGNCIQQDTTHLLDIVDVCCKRKTDIPEIESGESLQNEKYLQVTSLQTFTAQIHIKIHSHSLYSYAI